MTIILLTFNIINSYLISSVIFINLSNTLWLLIYSHFTQFSRRRDHSAHISSISSIFSKGHSLLKRPVTEWSFSWDQPQSRIREDSLLHGVERWVRFGGCQLECHWQLRLSSSLGFPGSDSRAECRPLHAWRWSRVHRRLSEYRLTA